MLSSSWKEAAIEKTDRPLKPLLRGKSLRGKKYFLIILERASSVGLEEIKTRYYYQ